MWSLTWLIAPFVQDFGRVALLEHRELSGVYRCSDRGAWP